MMITNHYGQDINNSQLRKMWTWKKTNKNPYLSLPVNSLHLMVQLLSRLGQMALLIVWFLCIIFSLSVRWLSTVILTFRVIVNINKLIKGLVHSKSYMNMICSYWKAWEHIFLDFSGKLWQSFFSDKFPWDKHHS